MEGTGEDVGVGEVAVVSGANVALVNRVGAVISTIFLEI